MGCCRLVMIYSRIRQIRGRLRLKAMLIPSQVPQGKGVETRRRTRKGKV